MFGDGGRGSFSHAVRQICDHTVDLDKVLQGDGEEVASVIP